MKKIFLVAGATVALSFSALAAPTCSTTSGYNNVISGAPNTGLTSSTTGQDDPCTVSGSDLTFSNFSYDLTNGSFTTVSPTVNLVSATPAVTVVFNPNLNSNSDLELEFEVTGGIDGVTLGFNGSTGFVNEVLCTVFTATGVCPQGDQIGTTLSVTPTNQNASLTLNGSYSDVWVFKDINVGSGGGLSEVSQSYIVPEPMTLSLMGAGLLGVGLIRRRRVRK